MKRLALVELVSEGKLLTESTLPTQRKYGSSENVHIER